jgi:hypothetical protein
LPSSRRPIAGEEHPCSHASILCRTSSGLLRNADQFARPQRRQDRADQVPVLSALRRNTRYSLVGSARQYCVEASSPISFTDASPTRLPKVQVGHVAARTARHSGVGDNAAVPCSRSADGHAGRSLRIAITRTVLVGPLIMKHYTSKSPPLYMTYSARLSQISRQ